MCKTLYDRNIETTRDIYNAVEVDDLVKFSVPFHMNMIAKNKVGLKNMFKIISDANTIYLFRNDQPKVPRKELIQYCLIIVRMRLYMLCWMNKDFQMDILMTMCWLTNME